MGKFIVISSNKCKLKATTSQFITRPLAELSNFTLSNLMARSLKFQRLSLTTARATAGEARRSWLKRWKLEREAYLALVTFYNCNLALVDLTSPSAESEFMIPLDLLKLARKVQAVRLNK